MRLPTRNTLSHSNWCLIPHSDPAGTRLHGNTCPGRQLLKILLIGDSAEQPVPSVAIKFGVAVNILHGKIEYTGERWAFWWCINRAACNPTAVAAAVEHIRQRTAQVR